MSEYADIRQDEPATNETPAVEESSDSSSLPVPSLDTRQVLLAVAVVALVAVVVWQLRQRTTEYDEWEEDEDQGDGAVERVEDYDFEAERMAEDGDGDIRVPSNPDNELDKDAAVLDGLREAGVMSGGGEA